MRLAWTLAGVKLALHLATIGLYGFHRDELALAESARRVAWGSIDHAPLAPAIAALAALGPWGPRVVSALAGAAIVFLTVVAARRLGGDAVAQLLAGGALLVSPIFIWSAGVFGTVVLDQLAATAAAVALLVALDGVPRAWLAVGAAVGVGALAKPSAAYFGAALVVGLLGSPGGRAALRGRDPWLAALGALAFASPWIAWQLAHGWPTLEFLSDSHAAMARRVTPARFLVAQATMLHPLALVLAAGGVVAGLRRGAPPAVRAVAIALPVTLLLGAAMRVKPYYPAPLYPLLLAAGAVVVAPRLSPSWHRVAGAVGLVSGVALFLGTLPLLPAAAHIDRVHPELHQFADWPDIVRQIRAAGPGLPVLTDSYGTAAALERWGDAPVLSGANSWSVWSRPRALPAELLALGYPEALLRELFARVEPAGRVVGRWSSEDNRFDFPRTIYRCRDPRLAVESAWPRLRRFD